MMPPPGSCVVNKVKRAEHPSAFLFRRFDDAVVNFLFLCKYERDGGGRCGDDHGENEHPKEFMVHMVDFLVSITDA